jgi:hypothetical protein
LERDDCQRIVDRLVKVAYLRWTTDGAVTRAA